MTEERVSPLRQRMIEDMSIRGLAEKTQKAHIRNVKHFAAFLGRPPDTATPEELRAYQLKMTEDSVSASTFNVRIISLRFFFGTTCGREDMKRFMQFHRKPRKLPIVLSVEEVADLLAAVPGLGLKYRAALGISYGAGLRASEVCNLKVTDIDSDRMLIHVDDGKGGRDRKAMLSPNLLALLRDYWCEFPSGGVAVPGQAQNQPAVAAPVEPGVHLGQAHGGHQEGGNAAHAPPQLRDPFAGGEHGRAGHSGVARPRQADNHCALRPCGHQDDLQHRQPL